MKLVLTWHREKERDKRRKKNNKMNMCYMLCMSMNEIKIVVAFKLNKSWLIYALSIINTSSRKKVYRKLSFYIYKTKIDKQMDLYSKSMDLYLQIKRLLLKINGVPFQKSMNFILKVNWFP